MSFEDKAKLKELARNFSEASGGRGYKVPEDIKPILERITKGDAISYKIMGALIGSESGFRNVKSNTGASGYGQFTFQTLKETAWKNRNNMPSEYKNIIEKNMHRVNVGGRLKYNIKSGGSESAIRKLATEAEPGLILAKEYIRMAVKEGRGYFRNFMEEKIDHIKANYDPLPEERLENLQEHLKRGMTVLDAKTFYMCGPYGGAMLMAANAEPSAQGQRALDFTKYYVARANWPVFYKGQKETNVRDFIEAGKLDTAQKESVDHFIDRLDKDRTFNPDMDSKANKATLSDGLSKLKNALKLKIEAIEKYDDIPQERLKGLKESLADLNKNGLKHDWQQKAVLMLGAKNGSNMLAAHADSAARNFAASDYVPEVEEGQTDPHETFKQDIPRSVKEYIEYMEKRVGTEPIPENLNQRADIAATLDLKSTVGLT